MAHLSGPEYTALDSNGHGALAALGRYGSLSVALLMIQVDNFALVVALPTIADDLQVATTDVSWAIGAYMIAFGVALIPGGRLGDMWGRKRTMIVGLGAFVIASAAAGMAESAGQLVGWRILQGLAGGLYSPLALSLVSTTVEPAHKGRVLGIVMGAAALGTAAGPIVGGTVTATFGWRWVLLVNLPIGIVAMLWGMLQLPESRDEAAASRGLRGFDWVGMALASVGVAVLSAGVELGARGAQSAMVAASVVLGCGGLALFVVWERRAPWPLVPPRLWRNRELLFLVTTCTLVYMALMVAFFVATVDAQDVRGLSPLVVGMLFIPPALGRMAASFTAGRLANRNRGLATMTWSMFAGALMLAALAVAGPLWLFVIALTATALTLGVGHQFGIVDVQVRVPGDDAGAAAGVMLTMLMLMGGLAVAVTAAAMGTDAEGVPNSASVMWTLLAWAAVVAAGGLGAWGLSPQVVAGGGR